MIDPHEVPMVSARMPLAEVRQIAETVYGPEWQSPLARDLGVAVRTVQRWVAGDAEPPDLRAELAMICRRCAPELLTHGKELVARSKQVLALAERLEAAVRDS